eukprot:TRINITY_DN45468_c0_g1_i1.p1 TRINITY_DN45468_c0_g1~~TRINITY_DN45468_c0_g1_i1.p1  ORF type:complete len:219 (+),score=57.29 TRINITY_DN45468_c0_g1_i1:82-738(+)
MAMPFVPPKQAATKMSMKPAAGQYKCSDARGNDAYYVRHGIPTHDWLEKQIMINKPLPKMEWEEGPIQRRRRFVKDSFFKYDADGSGGLDRSEFSRLKQDLGLKLDFDQVDTDKSGTVELGELKRAMLGAGGGDCSESSLGSRRSQSEAALAAPLQQSASDPTLLRFTGGSTGLLGRSAYAPLRGTRIARPAGLPPVSSPPAVAMGTPPEFLGLGRRR